VFGHKPWDARSTDSRLPVLVGDVTALTLRYQTETTAAGKRNINPALWINGGAGQVTVDGAEYGLWHEPNEGDRGDGTAGTSPT
jgi:hypothetical protein